MAIITASTPTVVPETTYSIYWIKSILVDNSIPTTPLATVVFYLGDADGVAAPGSPTVVYRVDIMAKINAGDSDLATLFGTLVAKAGAMAIADGQLTATIGA